MAHFKLYFLLMLSLVGILFLSWKNSELETYQFQLPSPIINKIIIDNEGVKWIATEKGIVSFDGTDWTNYTEEQSLNNGSVADLVLEITSGIKKLWMGLNLGLSSMEIDSTQVSVLNYSTKDSEILADTVSALGIDNARVKYIGTSKGLSILKGNNWKQYFGRTNEMPLSRFKISSIAISQSGYVYAATEGGGVARFKYTDAISGETTFNRPWAWGLPSDTVYAVATDGDEQWYGTNRGVAYHTTEFTKQDWVTYTKENGLICDTVYAIAKDLSGNMWFGTHEGVSRLSGDIWQSFTTQDGLVANKVNTVAVDIDGSMWFGTDDGISHYSGDKWENYQQGTTFVNSHKLSSANLFTFYPNPVMDKIRLKKTLESSEDMVIEIHSIKGDLVKSQTFKSQNQIIDVSDLMSGIYLLTISSSNHFQTVRIIKQ